MLNLSSTDSTDLKIQSGQGEIPPLNADFRTQASVRQVVHPEHVPHSIRIQKQAPQQQELFVQSEQLRQRKLARIEQNKATEVTKVLESIKGPLYKIHKKLHNRQFLKENFFKRNQNSFSRRQLDDSTVLFMDEDWLKMPKIQNHIPAYSYSHALKKPKKQACDNMMRHFSLLDKPESPHTSPRVIPSTSFRKPALPATHREKEKLPITQTTATQKLSSRSSVVKRVGQVRKELASNDSDVPLEAASIGGLLSPKHQVREVDEEASLYSATASTGGQPQQKKQSDVSQICGWPAVEGNQIKHRISTQENRPIMKADAVPEHQSPPPVPVLGSEPPNHHCIIIQKLGDSQHLTTEQSRYTAIIEKRSP